MRCREIRGLPQELEMRYGASADDIAKVTSMLRRYGLEVTHSSRLTRSMKVVGTAKQIETAFQTRLGIYKDASGRDFRDREGTYAVPKDLEGLVTAVIGLGQRRVARRRSSTVTQAVSTVAPLGPADLEQLYAFPPGAAAGEVIGIAEFGGGYFAKDLQAYCGKFRRPVPTINAIAVNAPAYTLQQILALPNAQRKDELDSSVEVMMDIELIAGLCSGAKLNVYFASFDQQGWVNLLNRAIEDRPTALSVSWGLAEDDSDWSAAARAAIDRRLNTAALLGISVCAAAGDDGSGDEETDGRFHVDFPAASPFVRGGPRGHADQRRVVARERSGLVEIARTAHTTGAARPAEGKRAHAASRVAGCQNQVLDFRQFRWPSGAGRRGTRRTSAL